MKLSPFSVQSLAVEARSVREGGLPSYDLNGSGAEILPQTEIDQTDQQRESSMSKNDLRLNIYLDDHLALMSGETELAARCRSSNRDTPLGDFLQQLEQDVNDQKTLLKEVQQRVGGKESIEGMLKQGAAWFAEKLGRLKLNDTLVSYSKLSRVVELETLETAAHERIALWENLEAVAAVDERIGDLKFTFFRDQTRQHLETLQFQRKSAAVEAFAGE
jgi:hypothetical protein